MQSFLFDCPPGQSPARARHSHTWMPRCEGAGAGIQMWAPPALPCCGELCLPPCPHLPTPEDPRLPVPLKHLPSPHPRAYLQQVRAQLLGHVVQGPDPAGLAPGVPQPCKASGRGEAGRQAEPRSPAAAGPEPTPAPRSGPVRSGQPAGGCAGRGACPRAGTRLLRAGGACRRAHVEALR